MYNTNDLKAAIRKNVKRHREEAGLTQKQMADKLCRGEKDYQRMESQGSGITIVDNLLEIANVFDVSIEALLYGKIEPNGGSDTACRETISYIKKKSIGLSPKECNELSIYFAQRVHDTL